MELYHISLDSDLIPAFIPSIPERIQDNEDNKVPRVCLAPTLEGCLTSIIQKDSKIHTKLKGKEVNVYFFDVIKLGRLIGHSEIVDRGLVSDAYLTGETWCLDPIQVKRENMRKIKIQGVKTKTVVYLTHKEREFWLSKHTEYLRVYAGMLPREELLKLTDFEVFLKYMKKQGALKGKLYRVVTELKYTVIH